jgi:hypothetical protein
MDGLRSTVITAFTVSLSCFLFFLLPSIRGPAAFAFFLLANSSLLFGLWLSFDAAVPISARLATTYLALAAMAHLWVGAWATEPAALAAMILFQGLTVGSVTTLLNVNWGDDTTVKLIAVTVIMISTLAIVGTVAMARRRRFGHWIWFAIVALSMIAGVLSAGLATLYHDGPPVWWSLFLPLTYAIAYVFALRNVELKGTPKSFQPPS